MAKRNGRIGRANGNETSGTEREGAYRGYYARAVRRSDGPTASESSAPSPAGIEPERTVESRTLEALAGRIVLSGDGGIYSDRSRGSIRLGSFSEYREDVLGTDSGFNVRVGSVRRYSYRLDGIEEDRGRYSTRTGVPSREALRRRIVTDVGRYLYGASAIGRAARAIGAALLLGPDATVPEDRAEYRAEVLLRARLDAADGIARAAVAVGDAIEDRAAILAGDRDRAEARLDSVEDGSDLSTVPDPGAVLARLAARGIRPIAGGSGTEGDRERRAARLARRAERAALLAGGAEVYGRDEETREDATLSSYASYLGLGDGPPSPTLDRESELSAARYNARVRVSTELSSLPVILTEDLTPSSSYGPLPSTVRPIAGGSDASLPGPAGIGPRIVLLPSSEDNGVVLVDGIEVGTYGREPLLGTIRYYLDLRPGRDAGIEPASGYLYAIGLRSPDAVRAAVAEALRIVDGIGRAVRALRDASGRALRIGDSVVLDPEDGARLGTVRALYPDRGTIEVEPLGGRVDVFSPTRYETREVNASAVLLVRPIAGGSDAGEVPGPEDVPAAARRGAYVRIPGRTRSEDRDGTVIDRERIGRDYAVRIDGREEYLVLLPVPDYAGVLVLLSEADDPEPSYAEVVSGLRIGGRVLLGSERAIESRYGDADRGSIESATVRAIRIGEGRYPAVRIALDYSGREVEVPEDRLLPAETEEGLADSIGYGARAIGEDAEILARIRPISGGSDAVDRVGLDARAAEVGARRIERGDGYAGSTDLSDGLPGYLARIDVEGYPEAEGIVSAVLLVDGEGIYLDGTGGTSDVGLLDVEGYPADRALDLVGYLRGEVGPIPYSALARVLRPIAGGSDAEGPASTEPGEPGRGTRDLSNLSDLSDLSARERLARLLDGVGEAEATRIIEGIEYVRAADPEPEPEDLSSRILDAYGALAERVLSSIEPAEAEAALARIEAGEPVDDVLASIREEYLRAADPDRDPYLPGPEDVEEAEGPAIVGPRPFTREDWYGLAGSTPFSEPAAEPLVLYGVKITGWPYAPEPGRLLRETVDASIVGDAVGVGVNAYTDDGEDRGFTSLDRPGDRAGVRAVLDLLARAREVDYRALRALGFTAAVGEVEEAEPLRDVEGRALRVGALVLAGEAGDVRGGIVRALYPGTGRVLVEYRDEDDNPVRAAIEEAGSVRVVRSIAGGSDAPPTPGSIRAGARVRLRVGTRAGEVGTVERIERRAAGSPESWGSSRPRDSYEALVRLDSGAVRYVEVGDLEAAPVEPAPGPRVVEGYGEVAYPDPSGLRLAIEVSELAYRAYAVLVGPAYPARDLDRATAERVRALVERLLRADAEAERAASVEGREADRAEAERAEADAIVPGARVLTAIEPDGPHGRTIWAPGTVVLRSPGPDPYVVVRLDAGPDATTVPDPETDKVLYSLGFAEGSTRPDGSTIYRNPRTGEEVTDRGPLRARYRYRAEPGEAPVEVDTLGEVERLAERWDRGDAGEGSAR